MQTKWKDIPGYEGRYQANRKGQIRSLSRKVKTWNSSKIIPTKVLKLRKRNGYLAWKNKSVHRLVAVTFIPNPKKLKYVNHKNGNKLDNRVSNLEWCTSKENSRHAWSTGLCENVRETNSEKAKKRTGSKNSCWRSRVVILTNSGKEIITVESLVSAVEWLKKKGFKKAAKGNICNVCNFKAQSAYGYLFKWENR